MDELSNQSTADYDSNEKIVGLPELIDFDFQEADYQRELAQSGAIGERLQQEAVLADLAPSVDLGWDDDNLLQTRQDEPLTQFEKRKAEHISQALNAVNEAKGLSGLQRVQLLHDALPELNLSDVDLGTTVFGHKVSSPLFVSSMTAGHEGGVSINAALAEACAQMGWALAVGSQRRQLFDPQAHREWHEIKSKFPQLILFGNIGITQVGHVTTQAIQDLVDSLGAKALFVHTNPLQECLQAEGTPQFFGGLASLQRLIGELSVPVILKEVGCGFSPRTLHKIKKLNLGALDVSGLGGTHWGRIESSRALPGSIAQQAFDSFADWGMSTLDSLLESKKILACSVWASGGVRNGVDAAKLLALGADMVGLAKPMLEAALQGSDQVVQKMKLLEFELRTAMFCTGCRSVQELKENQVWRWTPTT